MFALMPWRARRAARENALEMVRREFAPLFERAFPAWPIPFEAPRWGLEMEEMENEFVVRAEVPGFEASELEVLVTGEMLTIRAEHPRNAAEGEATERPYGRVERTMTMPAGVNREAVEARYHNGILEVHLPKAPEARPRRIEVRT